uniref:Uncharacterized protein n=1 Tax=Ciona savignyi TaxID=51511 RepID=H2ZAS0_CIOSA
MLEKNGRRHVSVDQLFESSSRLSTRVDEADGPIASQRDKVDESASDVTPTNPTLGDTSKSRTTLDDVLETIKQLEEEPVKLEKPKSSLEEKLAWIDELQSEAQSTVSKASTTHTDVPNHSHPPDPSNLLTEAKLHSIMTFLDEVDKSETAESAVNHTEEDESAKQLRKAEEEATQ